MTHFVKDMEKKADLHEEALVRLNAFIEQRNMRHTPERVEVLRLVCEMQGLFSIDDLLQHMSDSHGMQVSRATLFHAMDVFCDAGIVLKHALQRCALFELNLDASPRILLICRRCGAVNECKQEALLRPLRMMQVKQFSVEQTVAYLSGLCAKCRRSRRKKS